VHVVGAGVMGGDIAGWCAMRAWRWTLQDQSPSAGSGDKARGRAFQRRLRDKSRIRGRARRLIPDVAGTERGTHMSSSSDFRELAGQARLFAKLEAQAKPEALLASNTSSLKLGPTSARKFEDPSRLVESISSTLCRSCSWSKWSGARPPGGHREARSRVRAADRQLPCRSRTRRAFSSIACSVPTSTKRWHGGRGRHAGDARRGGHMRSACRWGRIELARHGGPRHLPRGGKELAGESENLRENSRSSLLREISEENRARLLRLRTASTQRRRARRHARTHRESSSRLTFKEAQAAVAKGIVADADSPTRAHLRTGFAPFRGGPLNYMKSKGRKFPDSSRATTLPDTRSRDAYLTQHGVGEFALAREGQGGSTQRRARCAAACRTGGSIVVRAVPAARLRSAGEAKPQPPDRNPSAGRAGISGTGRGASKRRPPPRFAIQRFLFEAIPSLARRVEPYSRAVFRKGAATSETFSARLEALQDVYTRRGYNAVRVSVPPAGHSLGQVRLAWSRRGSGGCRLPLFDEKTSGHTCLP